MGSVGFAALGRAIIKNNRAQRPESKRSVSLVSKTKLYVDPKKASPKLLKEVKAKILRDTKKRHQKIILITSIIFMILIFSIYFIISNY
jgi:hypothetical protein